MNQDNPKAAALRAKLDVNNPALAMSAHNPLCARLAAEAGFDAIWGSGFELSVSYAVPDANILPMCTHLEMMRAIAEVQDAPVVADIDTGFGNAENVAYIAPRHAATGAAAVVMEDKTFPKDSSLRPRDGRCWWPSGNSRASWPRPGQTAGACSWWRGRRR